MKIYLILTAIFGGLNFYRTVKQARLTKAEVFIWMWPLLLIVNLLIWPFAFIMDALAFFKVVKYKPFKS